MKPLSHILWKSKKFPKNDHFKHVNSPRYLNQAMHQNAVLHSSIDVDVS